MLMFLLSAADDMLTNVEEDALVTDCGCCIGTVWSCGADGVITELVVLAGCRPLLSASLPLFFFSLAEQVD